MAWRLLPLTLASWVVVGIAGVMGGREVAGILYLASLAVLLARGSSLFRQERQREDQETAGQERRLTAKRLQEERAALERTIREDGLPGRLQEGMGLVELERRRDEIDRRLRDLEGD